MVCGKCNASARSLALIGLRCNQFSRNLRSTMKERDLAETTPRCHHSRRKHTWRIIVRSFYRTHAVSETPSKRTQHKPKRTSNTETHKHLNRHNLTLHTNDLRQTLNRPTRQQLQHLQIRLKLPRDIIPHLNRDQRIKRIIR